MTDEKHVPTTDTQREWAKQAIAGGTDAIAANWVGSLITDLARAEGQAARLLELLRYEHQERVGRHDCGDGAHPQSACTFLDGLKEASDAQS